MPRTNRRSLPPGSRSAITLRQAVTSNKIRETEILLNAGVNPNQIVSSSGGRLLHFAARYGYLEIVTILLEHGAKESINKKNNLGRTPLHETVITKNKDIDANNKAIAALLLQHGANMFIEDNYRQSPLNLAMKNNHFLVQSLFLKKIKEILRTAVLKNDITTTKFLLDAKTNPNQEDDTTGCTLLHFAARYGFLEIANLLLYYGADVDKANKIGFTALHYAADNKHEILIQLLLNYGASKFIKDKQGKTAGQQIVNKDSKIASLLQTRPNFFHNFPREFENETKPINEVDHDKPLDLSKTGPFGFSIKS